jgi:hypothetical protein
MLFVEKIPVKLVSLSVYHKTLLMIIEPIEEKLETDFPLTARAVVNTSDIVPVRLMNVKPEVRLVHKGTSIGKMPVFILCFTLLVRPKSLSVSANESLYLISNLRIRVLLSCC